MKCRICGYEFSGSPVFCPMCGSKVEKSDVTVKARPIREAEEFSWNTYDFPKPRQMQDIKMEWNSSGVMKEDGSEGFIQTDAPDFQSQPHIPLVQETSAPLKAADDFAMPSWHMPEQKVADETPLWATQPLWDAGNLPPELQESSIPEGQMFTARGYIKTMPIPQNPQAQVQSFRLDPVSPEPKEVRPQAEVPAVPVTQQEHAPQQFNTFYSKNDEFQKLLDAEYERARALRGEDVTLQRPAERSYTPETSVVAADLSTFEQMINEGTRTEAELSDATLILGGDRYHKGLSDLFSVGEFDALETLENGTLEQTKPVGGEISPDRVLENAQKREAAADAFDRLAAVADLSGGESSDMDESLEELISDLKRSEPDLDAVRVRNTIETRIRAIREKEAQNKRAAMAQARQAYFDALDEFNQKPEDAVTAEAAAPAGTEMAVPGPQTPVPEQPAEASAAAEIPAASVTPSQPDPAIDRSFLLHQTEPQPAESAEAAPSAEVPVPPAVPAPAVSQPDAPQAQPPVPETKAAEYNALLNEVMRQEPEEPKKERSHWFGKLLIALVITVVVLEAVVMGLKYFIPDHEVTQIAILCEQMVIDLCKEAYASASEFVTGLIGKYITK